MTVYFDKENFISFWVKANDDKNPKGGDLIRFLKNQVDIIHFNFPMDSLDDMEWKITEALQEGMSKETQWTHSSDRINPRPIIETSLPDKDGIYLLSDENVSKIQSKHTILIGGLDEETETIAKLLFDEDYGFHSQRIVGIEDFNSWNKIEQFSLPFSTMLIVDRYMFKGNEIGGNIGLFDQNIGIILSEFFKRKKGEARLIFVYQINDTVSDKGKSSYDEGPNFDEIRKKIQHSIKQKNENVILRNENIILIGVPQKSSIQDEHDRYIITNYLKIKSGDSFVYFNSNGIKITNSNELDIYSLGRKLYRQNTIKLIGKIKNIALEAQKIKPQRCSVKSKDELELVFDFYPEYFV